MTPPVQCRLLRDPPASGVWNMAVDEVLLERAAAEGLAFWRFYAWSEPTVSLGYFQTYADRFGHESRRGCPVVRRWTGGGAIVHDQETTYSLVLPPRHRLAARRDLLYRAVHEALIETLGQLGVVAHLCGEKGVPSGATGSAGDAATSGATGSASAQRFGGVGRPAPNLPASGATGSASAEGGRQPFLCFQRRSPGDVLLGALKIAGSAQRRRDGAVLQPGSLLVRRSTAAPELPGLEDLVGRPVPIDALTDRWLACLAPRLDVAWSPDALAPAESHRAALAVEARYATSAWIERRGRNVEPYSSRSA